MRNHIPCMAYVIQLALGAYMSSLSVEGHPKSWEAPEGSRQFGDIESTDIGKCKRPLKEANARIDKVSAMRPGLAKIIEKARIPWHFERPENELHIAENARCIDYADTWSSKWVRWLSRSKCTNHLSSDYGCENMAEFDTGVGLVSTLITPIHPRGGWNIPYIIITGRSAQYRMSGPLSSTSSKF